jgi:hypothetical protein
LNARHIKQFDFERFKLLKEQELTNVLFSAFSLHTKVYDAINEHPDAVNLSPLIETVPQNKAIIEFHAIACAGITLLLYITYHQSLYCLKRNHISYHHTTA